MELNSRIRAGHQQSSSWCKRATVLYWSGHDHKPGELAHCTAGQLQVHQKVFFSTLILQFLLPRKKLTYNCNKKLFCSGRSYTLPWLDAHWGDCYGSRFLSSEQWAECSMTVRQTSAPPPPFSLSNDKAHTPPQAVRISKLK